MLSNLPPVATTLLRAKELIDTPDKWCQRTYAAKDGRICAAEALSRADAITGLVDDGYSLLSVAMGDVAVSFFNDTHTHAEVMAAFDRAIAAVVTESVE